MLKRTVIDSLFFDVGSDPDIICISPEDDILSKSNRIRITTKHGCFDFKAKVKAFVPSGAIAVDYRLRKKFGLKDY